jgi:hypothetical protein
MAVSSHRSTGGILALSVTALQADDPVCDASIFPTIPRASTNLTTIAVAERTAAVLAASTSRRDRLRSEAITSLPRHV